jgi:hypothetical protein
MENVSNFLEEQRKTTPEQRSAFLDLVLLLDNPENGIKRNTMYNIFCTTAHNAGNTARREIFDALAAIFWKPEYDEHA